MFLGFGCFYGNDFSTRNKTNMRPFGDGNGRIARLLEFYLLMDADVPLPAAHLLSDHYNKTRSEYYRQLDRASKSCGGVLPFPAYACQGLLDGLRTQVTMVREQQQKVAWENYVHEVFRQMKESASHKRQRERGPFSAIKSRDGGKPAGKFSPLRTTRDAAGSSLRRSGLTGCRRRSRSVCRCARGLPCGEVRLHAGWCLRC